MLFFFPQRRGRFLLAVRLVFGAYCWSLLLGLSYLRLQFSLFCLRTVENWFGLLYLRSPRPDIGCPKNLLRLFFRNNLARLKITSEAKNNLKRLF